MSRQSIYNCRQFYTDLKDSHNNPSKNEDIFSDKDFIRKNILALKLSCNASVSSISEFLKIHGYKYNSVGYVSETLQKISTITITNLPTTNKVVNVLADEIFIGNIPILVIIDANTHLILAIEKAKNRTGESWKNCFVALMNKGYHLGVVAKDLGTGLAKGLDLIGENENISIVHQADLFHLIMRFRSLIGAYEKSATAAIQSEEKRLKVLDNRKTEEAVLKQTDLAVSAIEYCDKRIAKYDDFMYLHHELREAFNPFSSEGALRTKERMNEDITTILDLMDETFERTQLKGAVKFLRKNLNQYYPYVKYLDKTVNKYTNRLPDYLIKEVCLGYQKGLKSMAIKDYQLSKKIRIEAEEHLSVANDVCANVQERALVNELYQALTKAVRSSSALEAKNSVLRKFFNASQNQVTQSSLNLIAFYMNHKVTTRGKYKGYSPVERHTGLKFDKNYLELLLAE